MGVGKKIEEIANDNGKSIRQVAKEANLPYNTVYSIVKRDSSRVEPETLEKIANALGVPVYYLIGEGNWLSESDADNIIKRVSRKVKENRIKKGFSRNQLDLLLGWPYGSTEKLEKNQIVMNPARLKHVANQIGVNVCEFINGKYPDEVHGATNWLEILYNKENEALDRYSTALRILGKARTEEPSDISDTNVDVKSNPDNIQPDPFTEYTPQINSLIFLYNELNEQGQQVALERIKELNKIPDYRKDK